MGERRPLHFVFKIGDRDKSVDFYTRVLGMKVLRHEEFEGGCKATCNGPYNLSWSKTMIGYGHEDTNYVIELTYNYGIHSYVRGNEFQGITMIAPVALKGIKESNYPSKSENGYTIVDSPAGYTFRIKEDAPDDATPELTHFTLSCSNLKKSVEYWRDLAKMKEYEAGERRAVLGYDPNKTKLILQEIDEPVDRGTGSGRAAFSVAAEELPKIQALMEENNQTILTPLVSLDTPGKATVQVVILADPDGHEICFVGDEGFRELSKIDPVAANIFK